LHSIAQQIVVAGFVVLAKGHLLSSFGRAHDPEAAALLATLLPGHIGVPGSLRAALSLLLLGTWEGAQRFQAFAASLSRSAQLVTS